MERAERAEMRPCPWIANPHSRIHPCAEATALIDANGVFQPIGGELWGEMASGHRCGLGGAGLWADTEGTDVPLLCSNHGHGGAAAPSGSLHHGNGAAESRPAGPAPSMDSFDPQRPGSEGQVGPDPR